MVVNAVTAVGFGCALDSCSSLSGLVLRSGSVYGLSVCVTAAGWTPGCSQRLSLTALALSQPPAALTLRASGPLRLQAAWTMPLDTGGAPAWGLWLELWLDGAALADRLPLATTTQYLSGQLAAGSVHQAKARVWNEAGAAAWSPAATATATKPAATAGVTADVD